MADFSRILAKYFLNLCTRGLFIENSFETSFDHEKKKTKTRQIQAEKYYL
jgi:hypothetical protein